MRLQRQANNFLLTTITFFLLSGGVVTAQLLYPELPMNKTREIVNEQFRLQHFAMTAQAARSYLSNQEHRAFEEKNTDVEHAKYYLALAAIKTGTVGWEDSASNLIESNISPYYVKRTAYALAQHYFQLNKLALAIPYYESAGVDFLSNDEIADEKFELAYCYFNNRKFAKAEPLFASIKEIKDGKYFKASNYYYGLLAYNDKNFKDALQSFTQIANDKAYRTVVPYYIAETYYFMGDKNKALEEAVAILGKKEKSIYDNDLHLLAAQCLFESEKYDEAKTYFEYYYEHIDKIRKEDLYKLAYCSYRGNDWSNAIEKFKLLSNAHDSLGQTAMYLLGDCYLKLEDKPSARSAFGFCADLKFNKGQQESSMMLHAMISYEMGYDDQAARQLKNLLFTYPGTQYKDEANTLLSELLIKTQNYSEALKYLEKVTRKDEEYRNAFQKAAFGYATQLLKNGDLLTSGKYFEFACQRRANTNYETAAFFWRGEIAYRLHQYQEALNHLEIFITRKGENSFISKLSPLATKQHAYITMGFAAKALQNYDDAQEYFNLAQQSAKDDAANYLAALNEADAVFMQKKYPLAIMLYNKIIANDSENSDYARFQKSIILGLQGKHNEKIGLLLSLVNKNPVSSYNNAALYEVALTFLENDKYKQALGYLKQLTDSVPEKNYAAKGWMKIGYIYQETKDDEKAIEAYKHVAIEYPASEERMAALDALKYLFIKNNRPASYADLLRDNRLPSADSGLVDSAYYSSAEMLFSNGKWDKAQEAFNYYLAQYPNGIFAIKAHYYRAECNYQLKNYNEALKDYDVTLNNNWNDFCEISARHAGDIAFLIKDYKLAYKYYMTLRMNVVANSSLEMIYSGLMKCSYYNGKQKEAVQYADSLLLLAGVNAETINEALLFKARFLQSNNKIGDALPIYKQLTSIKNGETASESRYRVAELYLALDSLKKSEEAANNTIRQSAGYDFWIVKSYILLGDILTKEKDYFNAKATLESIVSHTKIPELKKEAQEKLENVRKLEKQKSKLKEDN